MGDSSEDISKAYDDLASAATYQAQDLIQNYLVPFETEIQRFIEGLTVSQLAPVQSYESVMGRYQDLLTSAAQGNIDALSELESYLTGTMLPFLQVYTQAGATYSILWDQIMADLQTIPETITQGTTQDTSIGSLQIDPALLAILQSAGLIHAQAGAYVTQNSLMNLGEKGPEWVVPTYSPERDSFLRSVGVDADAIAAAISAKISRPEGSGDGELVERQPIYLMLDGRVIAGVMVEQGTKHGEYIRSIKKIAGK